MTRVDDAASDKQDIKALWEAVRDLPPAELEAFLASNSVFGALRKQVESVLGHASDAATHSAADPMIGTKVAHYEVIECIGQGGMGRVYRATDLRLQRPVALKLLRPRTSDDVRAKQRLLVEARAAAALDHANICTIYEVGETADQVPFIAMAYYPGETLEQALQRGPLETSAALDYARQVARGLGAAHARGIIHRDVKPANIIVTSDGVAKLLDFGIARFPDVDISREGVTPGTIAYMSPEQVASRPLDRRTDLWSLGVVLYEMCAGGRPFGGESLGAVLHAIVNDAPAPPSTVRRELPAEIDAILARLLAKDPEQRYRDADHLISDLTRISSGRSPTSRMADREAVAEPIMHASARPADTSTAAPRPAPDESRRRWVRRATYGVAALGVGLGIAFWPLALEYAERDENPPAVLGQTRDGLLPPGSAMRSGGTQDTTLSERRLAAMDLIEQARNASLFRTDSGRQVVLRTIRKALETDSTFALAHASMALCLAGPCPDDGPPRRERLGLAEKHAQTAVRLDSLLPDAHAALGLVLMGNYRFVGAEQQFKRAIELDTKPSQLGVWSAFLIWLYVFMERPHDALEEARRYATAEPTAPNAIAELARGYMVNRRCGDALAQLDRLKQMQPPPARVPWIAAQCFARQQKWQEGIAALRAVGERNLAERPQVGFLRARAGQMEAAYRVRDQLLEQHARGSGRAYHLVVIYTGLRDFDKAFEWLDKSFDDRSLSFGIMEPAFEELHRDPRFDRLRVKLGIRKSSATGLSNTRDGPLGAGRINAMDLYNRGRAEVLFRTDTGRRVSRELFRQAIAADSTFAPPHAGLALLSLTPGDYARGSIAIAEQHARTAIRLDSLVPEAHTALGRVMMFNYRFAEAEPHLRRAVELDPKSTVREFLIWLYVFTDRPRDALDEAEEFVRQLPTASPAIAELAHGLLVNGRCDEALAQLDRLKQMQPPPARAGNIAAQCHAQRKEWPQAIRAVRQVAETNQRAISRVGYMLARAGQTDSAMAIRDTLLAQRERGETAAFALVVIYAGLGDFDRTFYWLERAYDDRSLAHELMEPMFEEVRRDPRFDGFRRKLGIQKR